MSRSLRSRKLAALSFVLALGVLGLTASVASAHGGSGSVYTLTNDPAGNAVKVFDRAGDGSLTPDGQFATGGAGTGGGLGNQGALVLDGKRLFAVNPGSNSVSSLKVARDGLELIDTEPSGGAQPISVTVDGDLVYVLNGGGAGSISGFTVSRKGDLTPLPGSTRPLSGSGVGPAEVSFDSDGDRLVVTEKATNLIDTYAVGEDGLASGPVTTPSSGATPFGFAFGKHDLLIVSEAFGGAAGQSALSSYRLEDGIPEPITKSLGTTETAACWVVVTKNGRFTYTTNTGSASVTGYRIGHDGELSLLDADGKTGVTGAGPIDMALSRDSRLLYSLNSGSDTITAFRVGGDGSLSPVGAPAAAPHGATGLAAD